MLASVKKWTSGTRVFNAILCVAVKDVKINIRSIKTKIEYHNMLHYEYLLHIFTQDFRRPMLKIIYKLKMFVDCSILTAFLKRDLPYMQSFNPLSPVIKNFTLKIVVGY